MYDGFLTKVFDGNSVMVWLIFIGMITLSILMARIIYKIITKFLTKITAKTKNKLDDSLVDVLEGPLEFALIITGVWYSLKVLNVSTETGDSIINAFQALVIVNIAWLLSRLVNVVIKKYLVPIANRTDTIVDTQLLGILGSIIRAMIWIAAILLVLKLEGHTITSFITGIGIGGLALGFSSENIKNFFKSLSIFTQKPIEVGERIRVKGYDGTVEKIDIKRVMLRLRNGRLAVMPMETMYKSIIEKVSSEPSRKITLDVGLSYNSSESQIIRAMEILQEVVTDNDALEDNTIILPNAFKHYALNIQLIYYIKKGESVVDNQKKTNLEIYKRFREEKLEFA